MRKRQIEKLAKLYAANVVYNALSQGASSDLLTDDELEQFSDEVKEVALEMVSTIRNGNESLGIGSLDGLIKFVKGQDFSNC